MFYWALLFRYQVADGIKQYGICHEKTINSHFRDNAVKYLVPNRTPSYLGQRFAGGSHQVNELFPLKHD